MLNGRSLQNALATGAAYAQLPDAVHRLQSRGGLRLALLLSGVAHLALFASAYVFQTDASARQRELELSATAATRRSFDVSLNFESPPEAAKAPDAAQQPAGGANVKHVSRFNSDVIREHTSSIWNSIVYPRMARRMGWQGRVRIRAQVAADGGVTEAQVAESSGYRILDEAALSGVRQHRFTPGENAEDIIISLLFKLTDE